MADEQTVRVTVLDIEKGDVEGEPFSTLVNMIRAAWDEIPLEHQQWASFELGFYTLKVWYDRPDTEQDKRERREYERLKAKFEREGNMS